MPITKTTDLSNTVVTRYEKEYLLNAIEKPGVWAQFIDWQTPIPESGGSGSTLDFPIYSEQDLVEDSLTEDADIQPDTISDGNITLTPAEYGKMFAVSKKARYLSRVPIEQVLGKLVSQNRTKSIDRILRRSATGYGSVRPTQTLQIDGKGVMSGLTGAAGANKITYDFLTDLSTYASSLDIEPFESTGYHAIIHPLLAQDIKSLTEWKNIGYYQDTANIYGAIEKPFTLAGITFIPSTQGRLYLGSGTAVQAATTLSAGANKGATTITVQSATNLTAGDFVTIGQVETESLAPARNLEQVKIISVSSNTLTIQGNGPNDAFGLRFNHASGESVVEAANVAAIPLIGKNSIIGVHGSDAGRYGVAKVKDGLDYLDRFRYFGWYWFGGTACVQKRIILGKCATTKWTIGYN